MSKRMLILTALAALALVGGVTRAADPEPAVAPAAVDPALARNLYDVKVATDDQGRPVVSLVGDGRFDYTSLVLENPNRLVVDLTGVTSRLEAHQRSVGREGVSRVRAGQYRNDPAPVCRVVFDLDRTVPYHIERGDRELTIRFGATGTDAGAPSTTSDAPTVGEASAEAPGPPSEAAPPIVVAEAASAPSAAPPAPPADSIEQLLRTAPPLANEVEVSSEFKPIPDSAFETKTISTDVPAYTGKRISLNLVDADIKQVFRLFHEISGLNFVLDPGVEGRVTIVLDNVPWDQALDIILKNNSLDKLLENNVVRIASTQKLASEAASRKTLKEAKELEVEPTTVTRTLSYAKAKDVERVIRDGGILSPRGRVIVDERTNTLIVSDIPKKVEPLDKLVSSLDAETPQVMIEARIVETSKEFVQDFGVVWGMNAIADASRGTSTNANFPHNASLKYGLNLPGDGRSALALKLGNILDSFTLDVTLNALEQEGKTRILSAPKIATQNNERAEIEQGVRIPIVNTTATEINVEFVSASLKLSVTPQITAEGTIILDVSVENNSPDFVNKSGDTPSIKTQRAQTKILIADGGTTVIGGIFAVNESRSENGVPWFRKIPGLGWLFKSREIRNENRELLIFITPKIVKVG